MYEQEFLFNPTLAIVSLDKKRVDLMSIRLGDDAPNFSAETTDGTIEFHPWKAGKWAVFFSHPADYTPVCTTELGRTAALNSEFARRNVQTIAVSVDSLEDHCGWAPDISDVGGTAPVID